MRVARLSIALAALAVLLIPAAAHGDSSPIVTGAGSTWSQVAVDQWRADVSRFGLRINYQGVGSSAGRSFYIQNQVDFAVSEIPFEKDEINALNSKGKSYTYLPIVAGGTSLMYNLRDTRGNPITTLHLSSASVTDIFTGKITNWTDPELKADNPGLALPDQRIIPVVRSDGSGTSAQFTAFMSKMQPQKWCDFAKSQSIECTYTSFYPNFGGSVAQSGSDGVANYVHSESSGKGAITYVEAAYALQRGRPVAFLRNQSGNYTLPTSKNVSTALKKATLFADHTQNLDQVYVNPDPIAYAMSSYSYMIVPNKNFPTDKGQALGKFMIYFACAGQRKADLLGYSPLPPNLVQVVFDAEKQVPGAPAPPALKDCDNPTIQGDSSATSNDTASKLSGGKSTTGSTTASGGSTSGGSTGSAAGAGGSTGGSVAQGATGLTAGAGEGPAPTGTDGQVLQANGDGSVQALPAIDLGKSHPSSFPLAVAALVIGLLVFGPPLFGAAGTWKRKLIAEVARSAEP